MKEWILIAMIFVIVLLLVSILMNKIRYYFIGSYYNEIEHGGGVNNIVNLNMNGTFQYEYTMIPLQGDKNKGYKFGILEGTFKKEKTSVELIPKSAVECEFGSLQKMVQNQVNSVSSVGVNELSVGKFDLKLNKRKLNLILDQDGFEMKHIKNTKIPSVKKLIDSQKGKTVKK